MEYVGASGRIYAILVREYDELHWNVAHRTAFIFTRFDIIDGSFSVKGENDAASAGSGGTVKNLGEARTDHDEPTVD